VLALQVTEGRWDRDVLLHIVLQYTTSMKKTTTSKLVLRGLCHDY
jgi:hypothetical protein